MVFAFLENVLNLGIFTHASLATQNSPASSYHHTYSEGHYSFPQAAFFRKSVSPKQQKGVEETMIYFIRIHSKNMKII